MGRLSGNFKGGRAESVTLRGAGRALFAKGQDGAIYFLPSARSKSAGSEQCYCSEITCSHQLFAQCFISADGEKALLAYE